MAKYNYKKIIRLHKDNEDGKMDSRKNFTTILHPGEYLEGGVRCLKEDTVKTHQKPYKETAPRSIQVNPTRDTQWLVCVSRDSENSGQQFPGNLIRIEKPGKQGTFSRILTGLITFYQKAISIYLPHSCRFEPTCSEYTKQAIIKFGPIKGMIKGILRILRCNPLFPGGYDPV